MCKLLNVFSYMNVIIKFIFFIVVISISEQAAGNVEKSLTLSLSSYKTKVNLKKYGVNGALLGYKYGYFSEELANIYRDVGLSFGRFPGGTIGNYYDWKTGSFSCHNSVDKFTTDRVKLFNKVLTNKKFPYEVNDFVYFSKKINLEFSYVLNLMCKSAKSNLELMEYFKKNKIQLKYIEIGNEIYSPKYSWAYKDAKSYAERASEYYVAIKKIFPDSKIGLVVSPISFSGKNKPGNNGLQNNSWPLRQKEFDLYSSNSFYADGLIIHLYGYPYNRKISYFDPITNHEHFSKVLKQFSDRFETSMDYMESLGKGKPIWITEWGIAAPRDKQQGIFKNYKKSAYHSLFVASVLLDITLEDNVEVANYHNITDFWSKTKTGFKLTPLASVFKLFIDSATKSNNVNEVLFEAMDYSKYIDKSGLKAIYFSSVTSNYLLFINVGDEIYTINKLDVKFNKFKTYTAQEMTIINDEFVLSNRQKILNPNNSFEKIRVSPFTILRMEFKK